MTDDPSIQAMALAKSRLEEQDARIAELEIALRAAYVDLLEMNRGIGWRDGEWQSVALARSVLNKETSRA